MAAIGFCGIKSFLSISPVTGYTDGTPAPAEALVEGADDEAVGGPAYHSEKPLAITINCPCFSIFY